MPGALRETETSIKAYDGTNLVHTNWASDCRDKVRTAKLEIILDEPDPRLRSRFNRFGNVLQVGHPLFGQPQPRETLLEYNKVCKEWAKCSSRAAARVRLACEGTAKTVALAVPNQASFFDLMADLKTNFDTKDANSSGGLLHEFLNFTMVDPSVQDHCIRFGKLVRDLAEQLPPIVLPYTVSHKVMVDSLHERFMVLKTFERKTPSADLRSLFSTINSFARAEGIESKDSDEANTSHIALSARGDTQNCSVCGKQGHAKAECFHNGGGRGHWTKEARNDFFEQKFEKKMSKKKGYGSRRDDRQRGNKHRSRDDDSDDPDASSSNKRQRQGRQDPSEYKRISEKYYDKVKRQAMQIRQLTRKYKAITKDKHKDSSDSSESSDSDDDLPAVFGRASKASGKKRSKRAYMAKKARCRKSKNQKHHITHRATVGTINDDADSNDDMDVPTARKGEVVVNVDSGATDNFVMRDCKLINVRKCKPIEVEVAAGESIIADERGDLPGWLEDEYGNFSKILTPCIRGDFNQNLLAVRACNRAGYSVLLDEDGSYFTKKSTGERYPVECHDAGYYLRIYTKRPRHTAFGSAVQKPHVVDAMEIDQGDHLHLPSSLLPPSTYQSLPHTVTKTALPQHTKTPVVHVLSPPSTNEVPQVILESSATTAPTPSPTAALPLSSRLQRSQQRTIKVKEASSKKKTAVRKRRKLLTKLQLQINFLRHRRTAHASNNRLLNTSRSAAVHGLENYQAFDHRDCTTCFTHRGRKAPFQRFANTRANTRGTRVHTDMKTLSERTKDGFKICLVMVDDATRKRYVVMLKRKSEFIDKFEEYRMTLLAEGVHIRALRSDNDGTYRGSALKAYCQSHGIVQEFSPPHCPSANGVAEVSFRDLFCMARCILADQNRAQTIGGVYSCSVCS